MSLLQHGAAIPVGDTGFNIENSIKLEIDNNEWLYRNSPTAGNRKTFTISLWLKRACLGHIPAGGDEYLAGQGSSARYHFAGDTIRFMFAGNSTELESSRKYRDPSAWYHIVLAVDTTQGTNTNRVKLYTNGVQQSWSNSDWPSQNAESDWMNTNDLYIGTRWGNNSTGDGDNDLAGYLAEVVLLDGTAASPTSFGEFDEDSGIWKPIDVSGLTFGSQGFYLNFSNASSSGEDFSGNDNDLLDSNLSAADHSTDTPTNNFTTWNPLRRYLDDTISIREGGTQIVTTSGNAWRNVHNTIAVNKGKWYWEGELYTNEGVQMFGNQPVHFSQINTHQNWYLGSRADGQAGAAYYGSGDDVYYEGGYANSSASTTGDIISVALDCDNNKIHFAVNGTYTNSSNPVNNTNGFPMTDEYQYFAMAPHTGGVVYKANFGGYTTISISSAASDDNGYGTFEYAPPSGYYSLCTKNLAEYG
jgi:hypothetical protein